MQHLFICYNKDIERRLLKTVDKINGACHFDTLVSKWRMRSFLTSKRNKKWLQGGVLMNHYTMSIAKGRGDLRHNNREFRPKNADPQRKDKNITLVKEDLQKVYHELFDESVIKYNDTQKRNDRKIKNYFDKIYRSKKEKPFYEFIIQVGNQNDQPSETKCKAILKEFNDMLIKDYPSLRVFNSVIHMDESTPHLHIDFVPIGDGYKKGMEKRASFKRVLKNLGFSDFREFQNALFFKLELISKQHDIERVSDVAIGAKHIPIQQYREIQRLAEQKINDIDYMSVPRSSIKIYQKLNAVPQEMYEEIVKDNAYRKAQNEALTGENEILRGQLSNLKTEKNVYTYEAVIEDQKDKIESLNDEIEEIRYNFNTMQKSNDNMLNKAWDENDALQEKIEALEKSSAALKGQITDREKTIADLKNRSKDLEKMGQILTENEKLKNDVKKLDEKVKKTEQKLVQNSSETRSKLVKTEQENRKLEGQISSLKSENETLQNECKELNTEINDMRANSHRQERFIDAMKKCSRTNDMPRMANIAKLMANEQYDDLDEELDECLRRLRTARMRQ
jgi:predicted  nucleic acid-binding Zn-ribbon protein